MLHIKITQVDLKTLMPIQYPRLIKSESLGVDSNILKNSQGATKCGNQYCRLLSGLFANVINHGVQPNIMILCCHIKVHLAYFCTRGLSAQPEYKCYGR